VNPKATGTLKIELPVGRKDGTSMNAEFKIDPEFKLLLPPLTTEEYSELEKSLLGGKGPRPVLIPVFLTQGGHDVPNRQFRMLLPDLRMVLPVTVNRCLVFLTSSITWSQNLPWLRSFGNACSESVSALSRWRRRGGLRACAYASSLTFIRIRDLHLLMRSLAIIEKRRSLSSNPLARSTIGTSSFKKTVHKNSGVSAFPCTFHTSL